MIGTDNKRNLMIVVNIKERDGPPINAEEFLDIFGVSSAEHSMMQGLSCPRLDANACSIPSAIPVRRQADPFPPTPKPH